MATVPPFCVSPCLVETKWMAMPYVTKMAPPPCYISPCLAIKQFKAHNSPEPGSCVLPLTAEGASGPGLHLTVFFGC